MNLLQPGADRTAITVDVFRTIASLSEKTLLLTLDDLAKARDMVVMRRFFDLLKEDHSTGPFYDNNKSTSDPSLTFSKVLLKPLHSSAPMGDCDPQSWSQTQSDYFDHLMEALDRHPRRVDFLDEALFNGASTIQDPRFFNTLATTASLPFSDRWSAASRTQLLSPFAEAVFHQNSAGALALASLVPASSLSTFVDECSRGRSQEDKDTRGIRCLKGLFEMGKRRHLVAEALAPRLSEQDLQTLRLTMVKETLERSLENKTPWRLEDLEKAAGGLGKASTLAVASERHAVEKLQPLRAFVGADYGKAYHARNEAMGSLVMQTASRAIEAHCHPVLETMLPLVVWAPLTPAGNPMSNGSGVCLASAISQGRYDDSDSAGKVSPGDLKATMALLMAHGHSPMHTTFQGSTLLHVLGESNVEHPDWAIKLVALLDLGLDPEAVDQNGKKPIDEFQGNADEWEIIVKTHGSRKKALQALDEIDACAANGPVP